MKTAVIDVGFNSLKMVKYKIEPDGFAKPYGQLGVLAKLGDGLERTGYLGSEQISRTIDAIRLCRETAALEAIKHVLLVGTSPVREAANREEFLRRVKDETGLGMRVLSGSEEALYGALGAVRSVDAENVLFFDLGGGSLELAHVEGSKVRRISSLPLGALKLTAMYVGKDGSFSRKARSKMAKRISQLLPSKREFGPGRDAVLVGTGGTVRAMARFDQDEAEYPFDKVHNYSIGLGRVKRMSREFFSRSLEELGRTDAIGEGRAETVAAGTLIVRTLMEKMDAKRLVVSTHGLRDGILAEFLERGTNQAGGTSSKEEIERLLVRPSQSPIHRSHADLLGCMERNGLIDEREKGILVAVACRLRSPDIVEAGADGAFGILMSEDLPMSHEDQLLAALSLVRAKRARTANWLIRRYSDVLAGDEKLVKKMGTCVRLLEVLDRAGAQFRVAYSGGLRISVVASDGPFPLELTRMAALAVSSAVKKPVTVFVGAKERERHAGLVRAKG